MKKKLPVYKMIINENDDSGITYVALVDDPAIERNWFAFNNQLRFKADADRRIITGALMIADLPIYRNTPGMGEFYVTFPATEVEKAVQKFFKSGNTSNVNLMHDENARVDGVYMFESFIVDSKRGIKAPEGFSGITEGSWIGSYKVDNEEVWQTFIKTGEFKGYSIEGHFDMEMEQETIESQILKEIEAIAKI